MSASGDGAYRSGGGAASTHAHYDDMLTSARLLDTAGDHARALSTDLTMTIARLPVTGTLMSPGTAVQIGERTVALTIGPHGLVVLCADLELMARGVRLSVDYYRTRDAAVADALTAYHFGVALPHVVSAVGSAAGAAAALTYRDYSLATLRDPAHPRIDPVTAYERCFTSAISRAAYDDPSLTDDAVRSARLVAYVLGDRGDFDHQVAAILGIATAHGYLLDSTKLTVTAAGTHTSAGPRTKGSIGTLVADDAWAERAGNARRSLLSVHCRIDAQGRGHWVVDLPGTQNWGVKMPRDPSDATANVRSLADVPSSLYPAISAALAAAMRAQGVTPGSEPVMLVGHSQGGIVAARLAQNSQFRTRFRVTRLITVAAPTSRIAVPGSVRALSIEHTSDLVPRLDAAGEPDAVNRTYIRIDPRSRMRPGDHDPIVQHDPDLYADSARRDLGRDSTDPLVKRWYAETEGFMDGTDVRYDYKLHR
ncbi:alpha/beta fold hydrolase [Allobranchiibius sp. GilTou38]|uniref:alpha/beta fold hydrolase n=1 Tax=Allobranchiibius sp. GilTou38 TaxID=2815210 RepID=UPI001AA160EC|nr:alpha/beta fold hydrolase [Allobranchiibius sp. GilTou38]MBO1765378.1 alpha/beta fold hydrolase [Allobranchiibius sp. GilTou38]